MACLRSSLVLSLSRDDASLLWSVVTDDVVDLVTDHLNEVSTIDPERCFASSRLTNLRHIMQLIDSQLGM